MFEPAGSFGTILLGLGGLGALLAVVFAVVGILGKRVPLLAWLFMPIVITLAGAVGSWMATGDAEMAVSAANDIGAAASTGLEAAYGPRWLGHWIVAALSTFSIWCAAISALIKPGGETRATPFVAIMALLISVLTPVGTVYYALSAGLDTQALVLIGMVSFGGIGCALIAFRRALHEAAYRFASLRFAAGILMIFTAAHGARALSLHGSMNLWAAKTGTVFEGQYEAIMTALSMQSSITTLCWLVFGVALAIALFTFMGELGEIVDKFFLFDVTVVLVLLLGVGVFRWVETDREDALVATANVYPLGELISRYSFQLPAAAVSGYIDTFDIPIRGNAFGDIIVYGTRPSYIPPEPPENPVEGQPAWTPPTPPVEWFRAYTWTGSSWKADDTPLDEIQIAEGQVPLIAAPGGIPATDLVDLLKRFGGQAHILLRKGELATQIDREVAYTEASWMTIRLTDGIDYENDLYAFTERYDPYSGVARYIGAIGRNDKSVHRIASAIEETGATAMRATLGERTRLDHIAALCLATEVVPAEEPALDDPEDAPTLREGVECTLVEMDIDEAIAGAVETLGLPESDNVTLAVTVEEGIDPAAEQAVRRELAAFEACAPQVQDDMGLTEPITGRLATSFTIDDRGRAGRFEFEEERRDIDIFDMKLCVRERLSAARFPEYERPEPPEPELDAEGNEIEVELPPLPRVQMVLNYR